MDTHAIAQGQLQGKKYSRQLTGNTAREINLLAVSLLLKYFLSMIANDCFELGRQSYNNGDHYHTVLWMAEALRKHDQENDTSISRQEILEYLAFSTFKQGEKPEFVIDNVQQYNMPASTRQYPRGSSVDSRTVEDCSVSPTRSWKQEVLRRSYPSREHQASR